MMTLSSMLAAAALWAGCGGGPQTPGNPATGGAGDPRGQGGSVAGAGGAGGAGGAAGAGGGAGGEAGGAGAGGPDGPSGAGGAVGEPPDAAADASPPASDARGPDAAADASMAPWSALTAGWTLRPFTFALHKPYDLAESDRHSFNPATDTHTFWTLRGDKSHQPPPNSTGARSELRMRNDYTSGNHQFEADVYVVSGTTGACVMQVFGGVTNATSLMLVASGANGGTVTRYDGPAVIKAMAYDRWWHLNVIHEANGSGIGKIKVYADGQPAGTFDDRGNANHYFKCGVYNNGGDRAESRFRNIKYWVK